MKVKVTFLCEPPGCFVVCPSIYVWSMSARFVNGYLIIRAFEGVEPIFEPERSSYQNLNPSI